MTNAPDNVPAFPMSYELKIKVDWKELRNSLSELITSGFAAMLGLDAGLGGFKALLTAAQALSLEGGVGERVYQITLLSFGWAFDELTNLGVLDRASIKSQLKHFLDTARSVVREGDVTVPITFIDRPTTLPFYRLLRDTLMANSTVFRRSTESPEVLQAKFDAAFERGAFELRLRRPELWANIVEAVESGPVKAVERRVNWEAYRLRLINEFEVRPVFGQEATKVSLSQLYVPLRAYSQNSDDYGRPLPLHQNPIGMLDELLEGWLNDSERTSSIKLIGGGPGSGKSTSLKAFAATLARLSKWRPLFIPLQYIDLDGDLRANVDKYFTELTEGAFTEAPLSRESVEDGAALVLIFDGLDELARPGEGANEIVNLFSIKLASLLAALKGEGNKDVRAIVSGRLPSFQSAKRYIGVKTDDCLEVFGFAPVDDDEEVNNLWDVDQRSIWWVKYAEISSQSKELPPAFKSSELLSITHEPLLCYLLALSGYATDNWQSAAENQNRIYEQLVNSIWERGWGEGAVKRQGPGRALSLKDFNRLMQTIALAAWQDGDTRVATEAGFNRAVKLTRSEESWANFQEESGSDVTNLALNFYLKSAEGMKRGFEFTHKSFGEYLASRALLDFAQTLPELIDRRVDHALQEWLEVTASGEITSEILEFMRREVQLRVSDHAAEYPLSQYEALKQAFEKLVSTALIDGFPMPPQGQTWRGNETSQRASEISAWAVLNSVVLLLAARASAHVMIKVKWPDLRRSFSQMLGRWDIGGPVVGRTYVRLLSYVDAEFAMLFGHILYGADLRGANLSNTSLACCFLQEADLSGAKIEGSSFYRVALDNSSFQNAKISRCDFSDCNLNRSSWRGTEIGDIGFDIDTFLTIDNAFVNIHRSKIRRGRFDPDFSDSMIKTFSERHQLFAEFPYADYTIDEDDIDLD